jgi:hypothetical protein
MTQHRCWVSFETDRALQSRVKSGWYSEQDSTWTPLSAFPPEWKTNCWPTILAKWSNERGIPTSQIYALEISAKVKQHQIVDFIDHVYGTDPSYHDPAKMLMWKGQAYLANSLTNLRAFVTQELNPRLWYELHADEF